MLATKLRVWQIKPALLEANPHWLTNHRVLANGVAWGDESDPVMPEVPTRKRKGASTAPLSKPKKPKRATAARVEADAAESRLSALLDGEDEESLFERST